MTDPLRKPASGEPFKPSARQFGMFIDAAKAHQQNGQKSRSVYTELDSGIVLVQNDTEADLTSERPILALDDILFDPTDRASAAFERPVFSGVDPEFAAGRWCVLLGPIHDGGLQRAIYSGITWVKVDIDSEDHQRVRVDGDNTRLVSSSDGEGEILWKETGTGEKWAVVSIGNSEVVYLGKTTEALTLGTEGTIELYSGDLDAETGTGEEVEALPRRTDIDSGLFVNFKRRSGGWECWPHECNAE